ncbi:MAG: PEP-CTERM sorting domain-containing protein, partial [Planctomycetaceae bacterium]|nr:PEP-CTERM sorting domain-containing protein [Planctomycetaceae bacterium]
LFGIDIVDLGGVASNAGSLTLTFTANPEPGSLLLAGLALAPAGVIVRRRRNKQVQVVEGV